MALGVEIYVPALHEHLDTPQDRGCILGGLAEFQEHLGGRLTVMLLEGIGRPFDVHDIRADLVTRSIDTLKTLKAQRAASSAKRAS
jgi:3-dehydroquinate synthase